MTILRQEDLEFARRHLERFEDTDFFPSFSEYEAIWADWENFCKALKESNVAKLPLQPANAMPVAKGLSTYRIVHQLEPLTCIVYTALANSIGPSLEAARVPVEREVACSNRYAPDDGAFFSKGSGYDNYKDRTDELALEHGFVATADISDFFNQIYTHRVQGSIEAADAAMGNIASDIETLLHAVNSGASKGIPVGAEASRLIAEGVLIDVDQLIMGRGIAHTRYVDDIRMFSDDEQSLRSMIEELSDYLYGTHRLNLNAQKTGVYKASTFISRIAPDHRDAETEAALIKLSSIDPYGESGLGEDDLDEGDILSEIAEIVSARFKKDGFADHALLKSFLRRSRYADSLAYVDVAERCLQAFVPVFHELAKTLQHSISHAGASSVSKLIYAVSSSPHYRRRAVKMWLLWICAGSAELLKDANVRGDVYTSSPRTQARAATTLKDLPWIRSRKSDFSGMALPDKIATMATFRLLGADERKATVNYLNERYATPVEMALKRWVVRG